MRPVYNNTNCKVKLDYNAIVAKILAIPTANINATQLKDSFIIVKQGAASTLCNWLYTPTTLIDADYPKSEIFAYICNYSDVDLTLCVHDRFTLIYEVCTIQPTLNYHYINLEIFMQYKGLPSFYADIERLHKATAKAQGIDVTFKKEYVIESRGSLLLEILWHFNLQLDRYPLLFILRSRFARQGVVIQEINSKGITLINMSNSLVYLGNRFLQLVLPIPYVFEDGTCNFIDHKNFLLANMPVEYLDKTRKLKE